jgi:competence protein ComEC
MALDAADATPPGRFMAALAVLRAPFEAERDRWLLWLPVFLGSGIGAYFWLTVEPPLWGAVALVAASGLAAGLAARRATLLVLAAATFAASLGFLSAKLAADLAAAPVLERRVGPFRVEARVISVELFPEGARVLAVPRALGPERIRLRLVRGGEAPAPGEWIAVRAILMPPPPPVMPGAYDFQRQAWFERIGGVGFAVGPMERIDAPDGEEPASWRLGVAQLRHLMTQRILAALPPGVGGVAAALITGERGPIPAELNAAYRDSGLAHLLSISGIHMSLVAGIAFVAIRALLALVPPMALRWNIKKWAAALALVFILAYTVLSGASVPAQRSCLMAAIALLAVMIDRLHLSMRVVAWAAVVVMLMTPAGILGPSFQMSFAAVVGLIAFYETFGARLSAWRAARGPLGRFGFYFAALALTSLIATLATTPFSIYHFNRFAVHGLAANALAVPLTGFWVMPWAMVASLLMPFGLESWGLVPMGWGVAAINGIATTVAAWPGATMAIPALPPAGLLAITAGGLWLCVWRRRWRAWGVVPIVLGAATVFLERPPDILFSHDAKVIGVRDRAGGYLFSSSRPSRLLEETWTRRAGTDGGATWPRRGISGDDSLACDPLGCIYEAEGRKAALVLDGMALGEDCRAEVVVSLVPARRACRGHPALVDRIDAWRLGAHAVWLGPAAIRIETVDGWRGERPWVPRRVRRASVAPNEPD